MNGGEKLALGLIHDVWGGRGFPVDPIKLANELGLKVVLGRLPDSVFGAIVKQENQDAVIVLSDSDSKSDRRFFCAYELGHYVRHFEAGSKTYEEIDFRDHRSDDNSKDSCFARSFATGLLMPMAEVERLFALGMSSVAMSAYFGVSGHTMEPRLSHVFLKKSYKVATSHNSRLS